MEYFPIKKPYKFLNFWIKHEEFLEVVKSNSTADFFGRSILYSSKQIKEPFVPFCGVIYIPARSYSDGIKVYEVQFELHP